MQAIKNENALNPLGYRHQQPPRYNIYGILWCEKALTERKTVRPQFHSSIFADFHYFDSLSTIQKSTILESHLDVHIWCGGGSHPEDSTITRYWTFLIFGFFVLFSHFPVFIHFNIPCRFYFLAFGLCRKEVIIWERKYFHFTKKEKEGERERSAKDTNVNGS